ncbi:MAG: DUF4347 domain-containing protein [Magnetococcales bacterium]|nr:DUF4347 domain-containing protein [Magnetococcales bacterium]MBF0115039.1 DUF4347 domain-containing protein [Magnetococcales bacterium]
MNKRAAATRHESKRRIAPMLMALEPRWMFDGAAIVDATHVASDSAQANAANNGAEQGHADNHTDNSTPPMLPPADTGTANGQDDLATPAQTNSVAATRLLILSTSVTHGEALAAAAQENVTVVRYDPHQDDSTSLLRKIEEALGGKTADSIAFANHDSSVGSITITDDLSTNRYALALDAHTIAFWQAVGDHLSANGRIDLLGCGIAASAQGEALVNQLAQISGHAVAASIDATGNPASGGDWLLEQGNIDVAADYFDATRLASFSGQLGSAVGIYISNADGTDATLLKEIVPGGDPYIYRMVTLNGKVYFFAEEETYGRELWVSDGTTAGTQLLLDINPGDDSSSYSYATELIVMNNKLYFQADDGVHGEELWVSDGTAAGTVMVKDIWSGGGGSDIGNMTVFGNQIYFYAQDGSRPGLTYYDDQLWVSDGTEAGTQMVFSMPGHSMRHGVEHDTIAATTNAVYFLTNNGTDYEQLWKTTDGTSATTVMVKDLGSNAGDGIYWQSEEEQYVYGPSLQAIGDKVYFDAYTTALGVEAWVSDGTSAGTFNLTDDGNAGLPTFQNLFGYSEPVMGFTEYNNNVYFYYYDHLYKTDSTVAGTSRVNGVESLLGMAVMGETLYISGSTTGAPNWNYELLSFDGTTVSTVADLSSNPYGSIPFDLFPIDDLLYLIPYFGMTAGPEVWVSDGSAAGTHLVKDIYLGAEGSYPGDFTNLNGQLVFTAERFVNEAPVFSDSGDGDIFIAVNSQDNNLNDVLKVDDYDDDQTLTWSQSSAPTHGTLTFTDASNDSGDSWITPSGSITYTPDSGYEGSDSFVIQISDGTDTATRTINVTVLNNTAPLFVDPSVQELTIVAGSSWVDLAPYLHVNDPDNGQTLIWREDVLPSEGSLVIFFASAESGSADIAPPIENIWYQPSWNVDTFSIQVSDGISTTTRFFSITIVENVAPEFVDSTDKYLTIAPGGSMILDSYLHVSDSNSGQTLSWLENSAPAHGTLTFFIATANSGGSDIDPNGNIIYTPESGYVGEDYFRIQVTDDFASTFRNFYVTIQETPPNTGPETDPTDKPVYHNPPKLTPLPPISNDPASKESGKNQGTESITVSEVTVIRDKQEAGLSGKNNIIVGATPVTVIRGTPEIGATPVTVIRENNPSEAKPITALPSASSPTSGNFAAALAGLRAPTATALGAESGTRMTGTTSGSGGEGTFRLGAFGAADSRSEGLFAIKSVSEVVPNADGSIQFNLGANSFGHSEPNAAVQLSAVQSNGEALPSWISFDSNNGTLTGQPPVGSSGNLVIKVTAKDKQGREATLTLTIKMGERNNSSTPNDKPLSDNRNHHFLKTLAHDKDTVRQQAGSPASRQVAFTNLSEQLRAAQRGLQLHAQAQWFQQAGQIGRRA